MKNILAVFTLLLLVSAPALGGTTGPDLQITEIYSGQEGGDPTPDWFEVTNFGDAAWDTSVHGELYFEDDSSDPLRADLISGVPVIEPGQRVVFVDGGPDGLAEFLAAWSNVPGIVAGSYDGSGLSGGGDAVTLYTGSSNFPDDGINSETLLDLEAYPSLDDLLSAMDPSLIDGASYDVELGVFSLPGNASGAVFSVGTGSSTGNPALASPGNLPAIPEPGTLCLFVAGLLAWPRRTRA